MQDGGLVADNAVTPLQPARSRAVSPAVICGPTLRGDFAGRRSGAAGCPAPLET
jgi:hypothetical protein